MAWKGGRPPRPKPARLTLPVYDYNPQSLQKYSIKQLRKEYSRLRTIANKRIDRLLQSEFADTQAAAYNAGRYVPLKGVNTESELRHLLSDVARFITSEQSTITGQRDIIDRNVQIWQQEKGYEFINEGNVRAWTEFLEYIQAVEGYVYELESMADAFQEMELTNETRGKAEYQAAYELYQEYTSR